MSSGVSGPRGPSENFDLPELPGAGQTDATPDAGSPIANAGATASSTASGALMAASQGILPRSAWASQDALKGAMRTAMDALKTLGDVAPNWRTALRELFERTPGEQRNEPTTPEPMILYGMPGPWSGGGVDEPTTPEPMILYGMPGPWSGGGGVEPTPPEPMILYGMPGPWSGGGGGVEPTPPEPMILYGMPGPWSGGGGGGVEPTPPEPMILYGMAIPRDLDNRIA